MDASKLKKFLDDTSILLSKNQWCLAYACNQEAKDELSRLIREHCMHERAMEINDPLINEEITAGAPLRSKWHCWECGADFEENPNQDKPIFFER